MTPLHRHVPHLPKPLVNTCQGKQPLHITQSYLSDTATSLCSASSKTSGKHVIISLCTSRETILILYTQPYLSDIATSPCSASSKTSGKHVIISLCTSRETILIHYTQTYLSDTATSPCSASSKTSGKHVIISLCMSRETTSSISNIFSATSYVKREQDMFEEH